MISPLSPRSKAIGIAETLFQKVYTLLLHFSIYTPLSLIIQHIFSFFKLFYWKYIFFCIFSSCFFSFCVLFLIFITFCVFYSTISTFPSHIKRLKRTFILGGNWNPDRSFHKAHKLHEKILKKMCSPPKHTLWQCCIKTCRTPHKNTLWQYCNKMCRVPQTITQR